MSYEDKLGLHSLLLPNSRSRALRNRRSICELTCRSLMMRSDTGVETPCQSQLVPVAEVADCSLDICVSVLA